MQQPNFPVGGTPLLPPSYLTLYFVLFFLFLAVLYVYFYFKKRPVRVWHKIRLLIVLAFILKATALVGGGLLAAYWLIPAPSVTKLIPARNESAFSPSNKIEIIFDRPIDRADLEKSISPETPGIWVFEDALYATHLYRKLVFYPTYSLRPKTTYTIKLSDIRNLLNISEPYDYEYEFTTQDPPNVTLVAPSKGQTEVSTNSSVKVTLDKPNDDMSEFEFKFTPDIEFEAKPDDSKTVYTLTPKNGFTAGTEYNLKIQKSDVIKNLEDETVIERDEVMQQYDGNFVTKSSPDRSVISNIQHLISQEPVKVISFSPENGWTAVNINLPIKVTFDQAVNSKSAEQKFSISPAVEGDFSWDGSALTFTPEEALKYSTKYTIKLASGITSSESKPSTEEFKSEFTTQNGTTKLDVPAYLQRYTLSCEIASLRMALNYKKAGVTEDDLIPLVGLDPTPHSGNTWGDPHKAFVGNIRGTQMKNGYGVYWEPIAKAARNYRNAKDFTGWSIEQVTNEINNYNPVIIWIYSHNGIKTSWKTPDGTEIYAVRDEHAVVVAGYVGPSDNPTQMIINDPLHGQVYWSRKTFDSKWEIFGRSGVVVY